MEIRSILNPLGAYQSKLDQAENAAKAEPGRKTGRHASGAATSQSDTISLSPESRLRTEALATAARAPEIRQDKVDALKASVESGEYAPDSRQIAAKLLAEEPGLFRAS